MEVKNTFAIGVMSGTSLDGIDLVYVKFKEEENLTFKILHAQTIVYSKEWQQMLQNAIFMSKKELVALDVMYGKHIGNVVKDFMYNYKIEDIAFVASHGHTVLHEPKNGVTLQVGSGKEIAKITQQKVVCNFRAQDVALGGQGAPLVPIGDELLFNNYEYCLNLGGFSNVSFQKNNERIAFDICPVNIVLNYYTNKIGLPFDDGGKLAEKGIIHEGLLLQLNNLSYYKKTPPKSLGLEWVQKEIFPLIDSFQLEVPDILRTFIAHITQQLAAVIPSNVSVLITGGGYFNTFLISEFKKNAIVNIAEVPTTIVDFKEALIFALLGFLKIEGKVNCLQSVTGASKNHSAGVIFVP